ncbi:MAG: NEL-type E3 ubiquitin ligase domain-containing protein [Janthinobacterium lividum]
MRPIDPNDRTQRSNADDVRPCDGLDVAPRIAEPVATVHAMPPAALRHPLAPTSRRDEHRGESLALAHALGQALDCLDRLPAGVVRSRAGREALLTAIFVPATPDHAFIDPHFATVLACVHAAGSGDAGQERAGAPRPHRAATLLSAHLYALACPDLVYQPDGAFNVAGWRRFVSETLAGTGIAEVVQLSPIFVEDLRLPDPTTVFLHSLLVWVGEAGLDAGENRVEAATLIRSCCEQGHTALDLSYLGLTSLPGALWAVDRAGSACLAAGGLQELRLNGNRLTDLPEGIGQLQRLRRLSLNENQLSRLPDAIGELHALRSLRIADNELSMLPESVGRLQQLESLVADGCLLASLPPGIGLLTHLRELELEDNLLTSLPGGLAALPSDCVVRLFQNPLSPHVRAALLALAAGPLILVDALPESLSGPLQQAQPLSIAVFDWLTDARERSSAALARWRECEATPHARSFALLLDRWTQLPEALSWNTRAIFRTRINDLLRSIGERPGLARRCFAAASERQTDTLENWRECLRHLEALAEDDDAQRGGYALPELLRLAMQRYRLNLLKALASEKVADLRFADPADVYLVYRAALAERVDLPDDGYGAEDFQIAGITADDIALAAEHIAAAEAGDAVVDFLINYVPWRAGLCRHQPLIFEHVLAGFDEEGDKLALSAPEPVLGVSAGDPAALFRGLRQRQNAAFDAVLREQTYQWLGR